MCIRIDPKPKIKTTKRGQKLRINLYIHNPASQIIFAALAIPLTLWLTGSKATFALSNASTPSSACRYSTNSARDLLTALGTLQSSGIGVTYITTVSTIVMRNTLSSTRASRSITNLASPVREIHSIHCFRWGTSGLSLTYSVGVGVSKSSSRE